MGRLTIDPEEIRVGDRVRAIDYLGEGDRQIYEVTVTKLCACHIRTRTHMLNKLAYDWILLDRPERAAGSLWRDPETDARYVRTEDTAKNRNHYVRYSFGDRGRPYLSPHLDVEAEVIGRLVPLGGE